MGVFTKKIAGAKASFGANYGKEGRYWVILNMGKLDNHASKNAEQIIFEGTVIRVLDPGPAPGQRFQPTDGGNDAPHTPGEPFTFHFGSWTLGSEARAKRFLLVASHTEEKDLPAALNPVNYSPCQPGRFWQPGTGVEVPAGTPGALASLDPVEYAIEQATSPTKNLLKDVVLEVQGRGITTQGRANGGQKKKIIATDPVKRIWARDVHAAWNDLHATVQAELRKDGRIDAMLAREARDYAHILNATVMK